MLVIPPTVYQKRYVPKRKKGGATPQPSVQHIEVLFVSTEDPAENGRAIWAFTEAVTVTAIPVGLRVRVGGGPWMNATACDAVGLTVTEMRLTYPTGVTLGGGEWEIASTPTGIVQAGEIVVPESGEVTEP